MLYCFIVIVLLLYVMMLLSYMDIGGTIIHFYYCAALSPSWFFMFLFCVPFVLSLIGKSGGILSQYVAMTNSAWSCGVKSLFVVVCCLNGILF